MIIIIINHIHSIINTHFDAKNQYKAAYGIYSIAVLNVYNWDLRNIIRKNLSTFYLLHRGNLIYCGYDVKILNQMWKIIPKLSLEVWWRVLGVGINEFWAKIRYLIEWKSSVCQTGYKSRYHLFLKPPWNPQCIPRSRRGSCISPLVATCLQIDFQG